MSLRQAVAVFGRIILRHPYQLLSPTRLEATIDSESHSWSGWHCDAFKWIFISGQAVIFLRLNATPVLAEDVSIEPSLETDAGGEDLTGLRKVKDGSGVSNLHTSKWRVFTNNGRDLFLQGKLDDAERLFMGALQEAKEGFGEMDPHVASACNNLLQALGALGRLETTKVELQAPMDHIPPTEAENALRQCIAAFKKFGSQKLSSNSPEVNAESLSCLRHLSTILSSSRTVSLQQSRSATLQESEEEIMSVESEVSLKGKHRN